MKNYLKQIPPTNQSANLAILVVAVLWLVVPAVSQGSSYQLSALSDLSDAIGTLSELTKETGTSFGTRTDVIIGSQLLNEETIKKLQVLTASLISQTELKLEKLPPNHEIHLTRIGPVLPVLEIKNAAKQLKLTNLKNEVLERKLNPQPLKVVNLKLPVEIDTQWIFNAMDTNDDGEMSLEEFKTGTKLPDAKEHFNKIDTGNDDTLSFEEFQELLKPKSSSTTEND